MSSRRSDRLRAVAPNQVSVVAAPSLATTTSIGNKRKTAVKDTETPASEGEENFPSTPKRKRGPTKVIPPITPTPSTVKLMSSPYQNGSVGLPPAINRLAAPQDTNAALVTPETHRLIASKAVDQVSPSKKSNVKTTTSNILDEAVAHLIKAEPKLKSIIEKHPCTVFSPEGLAEEIDPFNSLVSGILSQQVGCPCLR
jgi:DNA-3-methyladenine glycosylase II